MSDIYIFFDIDGVLNSKDDWKKSKFSINDNCIIHFSKFINNLKKKNNIPHLIICSSWRQSINVFGDIDTSSNSIINETFLHYNLHIEDTTPVAINKSRQDEIEYYINRHNINSYIIIDDDTRLYPRQNDINLYVPDYRTGLTAKDIKKMIKQLD